MLTEFWAFLAEKEGQKERSPRAGGQVLICLFRENSVLSVWLAGHTLSQRLSISAVCKGKWYEGTAANQPQRRSEEIKHLLHLEGREKEWSWGLSRVSYFSINSSACLVYSWVKYLSLQGVLITDKAAECCPNSNVSNVFLLFFFSFLTPFEDPQWWASLTLLFPTP